jgi:uncharacterized protein (DUF2147 family)
MAQDITGFWKSVNEKTGKSQCVVAVYEYDGVRYGRIVGTYNDEGKMDDTIYKPKGRAPGLVGDPYYCGLDLIWDLMPYGGSYRGKIVDPEKGNVYNSELWIQKGNLIVRGKLLMFGRNQEWIPATQSDFPKGFKKIDTSKFVPSIPEVK